MKRILGALLFLMIILSACRGSNSTPLSTKVTIAESPTVQPTVSITITPKEPSPTYPPLGGTANALATEDALFSSQIEEFDVEVLRCKTTHNLPWPVTISPDYQWMTGYCEHEGGNLSLLNKDKSVWSLRDRDIFSTVKNSVYEPLLWSKDKENLFITTSHSYETILFPGTPDNTWCANPDVITLIKFNYRTGNHEFILGNRFSYEPSSPNSYSVAISSSEKFLASSLQNRTATNVVIKNLADNAEITIPLDKNLDGDAIVKSLFWSPDESKLLAVLTMCSSQRTKILLIDSRNSNLKTIPIELPERYYVQQWIEPNLVVITNYSNGNLFYYYLDLSLEKIVGPIQ